MPGLKPLDYEIQVCNPTVKDGLTKHITYTVKGTDYEGAFDVLRRFSDFYALREALVQKWPGCYIPPLPPKKAMGNMGRQFINERCKQLNLFCTEIVKCPHLYNSKEFQTFLRTRANEIEKALKVLPKEQTEDIIKKYHAAFNSLSGKTINQELTSKIRIFAEVLTKLQKLLKRIEKSTREITQSKKRYYQSFQILLTKILPDYEQKCLNEFSDNDKEKFLFNDQNNAELPELIQNITKSYQEESYEKLSTMIIYQVREVKAFLESFSTLKAIEVHNVKLNKQKNELTTTLQKRISGKKSFKSFFTRKTNEEEIFEIEKELQIKNQKISNYKTLIDIITLIQGYYEIPKFKYEKSRCYNNTLSQMVEQEDFNLQNAHNLWDNILNNEKIQNIEFKSFY